MRITLPATILLSILLAACASIRDQPPNKHISQSGTLKVHPGLLGQPVPGELEQGTEKTSKEVNPSSQPAAQVSPVH